MWLWATLRRRREEWQRDGGSNTLERQSAMKEVLQWIRRWVVDEKNPNEQVDTLHGSNKCVNVACVVKVIWVVGILVKRDLNRTLLPFVRILLGKLVIIMFILNINSDNHILFWSQPLFIIPFVGLWAGLHKNYNTDLYKTRLEDESWPRIQH